MAWKTTVMEEGLRTGRKECKTVMGMKAILLAAAAAAGFLLTGCSGSESQTTAAPQASETSAVTETGEASDGRASDGKSSDEKTSAEKSSSEDAKEPRGEEQAENGAGPVKRVKIGTQGSPKPYVYTDENDNLIGYEPEIVYALQKLLPQYDFEFEITDFQSIFLGVDSGLYDMAVNNISKKPEREEKYLYGDEYVSYHGSGVMVRKDYDEIQGLDDLGGKRTFSGTAGLYSQVFMEKYNEENPENPIEIIYSEADTLKQYQDLQAGVVDFIFSGPVAFRTREQDFPELMPEFKLVRFTEEEERQIEDPFSYFIYPRTEEGEQLKQDVDEALRTLRDNGTYTELGLKYYGLDTAHIGK